MSLLQEAMQSAVQYHQAGNLQQAERYYRQALAVDPRQVDALHMLGLLAYQGGHNEAARELITQALQVKPDFAEAHHNLGTVLHELGRLAEAVESWRQAIRLKPSLAEAFSNLGLALMELGRLDEACASLRQAVLLKPASAEAHCNLGNVLDQQGQLTEAVACFRQAVLLKPDYADAYSNLGATLHMLGQLNEATAACLLAVRLRPDSALAHNNLGLVLTEQKKLDEAITSYRTAVDVKPDFADAHYNLGKTVWDRADIAGAITSFRRASELKPQDVSMLGALVHALQHACQWDGLQSLVDRVIAAVDDPAGQGSGLPLSPFSFLGLPTPTTAMQQLRCTRSWVARQQPPPLHFTHTPRGNASVQQRRLTVGYLSTDFHEHAVAYLVVELFERHNRERFRTIGYSYGPDDGSPLRRRICAAFDDFVDIAACSPADSAARIQADGVDILVDLTGYTRDSRPRILAARPAPIQVNYLGYPGTMAAPFLDYILVDQFIVPPDQEPFFTEKLVHLPGCYQVNDSQCPISPRTPSREECGLPGQGFVFCCFNNTYKITPAMFGIWMELLQAVPDSVLWLLEANALVSVNLRREAAARGVDPGRLVFALRAPLAEHLARHQLADLALDCFPYCGHATTSVSLWAGCPVLTLAGQTMVSRVAGSLLHTIGLPELVTDSFEAYRSAALRLARDPQVLTVLRRRLADNRATCGLFDASRFARKVERAYEMMWDNYATGQLPRAIMVNPVERN